MQVTVIGRTERDRIGFRLRRWAFVFTLVAIVISLLVLAGWEFDIPILKGPVTEQVLMNPVTAITGLLTAIALLLFTGKEGASRSVQKIPGCALALLVLVIGAWKLFHEAGLILLPVDEWLYGHILQDQRESGAVGGMSIHVAVCFVLLGLSILFLFSRFSGSRAMAQYLSLAVWGIGFFSLLAHLYKVPLAEGGIEFIPMAFHTSLLMLFLAQAIFCATANEALMSVLTAPYIGSSIARFLIPTVVLLPVVLGYLRLFGYWYGWFSTELGVALLVTSIIAFFLGLSIFTVRILNARDQEKEAAAAALQRSEEETLYQAHLLRNISDAVVSTDIDFNIVSWNKAAEDMYGYSSEEVIGKEVSAVFRPIYEKATYEEILSSFFKNNHWKGEVLHHKKDGEQIAVLVSSAVMQKENRHSGTVAVIRDITARKRAEENFRNLLNAAPDATVIVDSKGIIQMVNKRVAELFHYSREELVGQPVEMLMPVEVRDTHRQHVGRYTGDPRVRPMGAGMELEARRKDGSQFSVEISLSPLQTPDGLLVSASIRDITARRNMERMLMQFNEELEAQVKARTLEISATNEQLRHLSAHLEKIREEERVRISREIHDELGQQLTGLKMDIVWLSRKVPGERDRLHLKFASVLELLDQMVFTVRRIAAELRPAVLDDLGLMAAIEWHSGEFERRFGIKVNVYLPEELPELLSDKATGIFRVYQESLTNVVRHAQATEINTRLSLTDGRLLLTVEDNGRGFDAKEAAAKKTLGLLGMKERVEMMGGHYSVGPGPLQGTLVSVAVPI